MSLLNNAKTMGGIGALLTLIGLLIPSFGFVIAIIGFILVIIAVKYISDEVKDKSIFNNFLYFFIGSIIAVVVAAVVFIITFIEAGGMNFILEIQNMAYTDPLEVWNLIQPLLPGFIAGLVILWVIMIISVIFLRKSFDSIADVTKVKWFNTTAMLYLLGAITLIVLIGIIIIIIGMVFEIIAFFSLPDKLPEK